MKSQVSQDQPSTLRRTGRCSCSWVLFPLPSLSLTPGLLWLRGGRKSSSDWRFPSQAQTVMIWYCFHLQFHNPLAQVQTNSWTYSFSVTPQSTKLLGNWRMKRIVVNENTSCNIAAIRKTLVSAHKTQTNSALPLFTNRKQNDLN